MDFVKGINMLTVSKMIAASWNEIKAQMLWLSWRKILPLEDDDDEEIQEDHQELDTNPSADEYHSFFQVLGEDLEESDIGEWRQADADDNGYAHLGDTEIILQVIDDVTETVDEPEVEPSCPLIPHGHAVKTFDSCIALATAARWS